MKGEESPIFLYNDPHPVHRRMALSVDAQFEQADTGGLFSRFLEARVTGSDRPVLLEGGVPLIQNTFGKLLGNYQGPSIILAADETQMNIHRELPWYSRKERWAHKVSHRYLDGAIAVGGMVAEACRPLINGPVEIANPFIPQARYEQLREIEPDLSSNRLVCIGEYRPANNQDALARAVESLEGDWQAIFVGSGTEALDGFPNCNGLGYVDDRELFTVMANCSLLVNPTRAGAYPVTVLEGLAAGLPVLTTRRAGNGGLVNELFPWLLRHPNKEYLATGLRQYGDLSVENRQGLSESAREIGARYQEDRKLPDFKDAYKTVIQNL